MCVGAGVVLSLYVVSLCLEPWSPLTHAKFGSTCACISAYDDRSVTRPARGCIPFLLRHAPQHSPCGGGGTKTQTCTSTASDDLTKGANTTAHAPLPPSTHTHAHCTFVRTITIQRFYCMSGDQAQWASSHNMCGLLLLERNILQHVVIVKGSCI